MTDTFELVERPRAIDGLVGGDILEDPFTLRKNLDAILAQNTFKYEDGQEATAETFVDSKTLCLYGGNNDGYRRFKIDNEFDFSNLGSQVNKDGTINIAEETYSSSRGAEFVIVSAKKNCLMIGETTVYYAVRSKFFDENKEMIESGSYTIDANFSKLNQKLTPEEVPESQVWQELAVGKNGATEEELEGARKFLADEYVPKVQEKGCFTKNGRGMEVSVETIRNDYVARQFFVDDYFGESKAVASGCGFNSTGLFLQVRDEGVANSVSDSDWIEGGAYTAGGTINTDSIIDHLSSLPASAKNDGVMRRVSQAVTDYLSRRSQE